jgi:hypothetical protein
VRKGLGPGAKPPRPHPSRTIADNPFPLVNHAGAASVLRLSRRYDEATSICGRRRSCASNPIETEYARPQPYGSEAIGTRPRRAGAGGPGCIWRTEGIPKAASAPGRTSGLATCFMRLSTVRASGHSGRRPFPGSPDRGRVSADQLQGMTDATAGVHRGVGRCGGLAGGGASAAARPHVADRCAHGGRRKRS